MHSAVTVLKRENNMDENRVLKRKEDTNVQDLFFIRVYSFKAKYLRSLLSYSHFIKVN